MSLSVIIIDVKFFSEIFEKTASRELSSQKQNNSSSPEA